MYAKGVTSLHPPGEPGPLSSEPGEDEAGVPDLADPTPGLARTPTPPSWLPSSVAGLADLRVLPTPSPPGTSGELVWGVRRRLASGPRILFFIPSSTPDGPVDPENRAPALGRGPSHAALDEPRPGGGRKGGTSPAADVLGAAKRGRERVKQGAGGGSGDGSGRESESGGGGGALRKNIPACRRMRGGGGKGSNRRRGARRGEAKGGRSRLRPTPSPPAGAPPLPLPFWALPPFSRVPRLLCVMSAQEARQPVPGPGLRELDGTIPEHVGSTAGRGLSPDAPSAFL